MQYYELLYERPEEVLQVVTRGALFTYEEYRAALTLISRSMRVFDSAALEHNLHDLALLCQRLM